MRRWLWLGLCGALACGAAPASREPLDETTLWGEIAPSSQALTFARRGRELLLVTAVGEGRVEAVRLAGVEDPVELLGRVDPAAVRRLARAGPRIPVALSELGLPVDLGAVHVAAGANFRAHGDEVGVDEPFLFPKLVQPTPFASAVPVVARLDYEVELCFVALRPLANPAELPGRFGVLLCNDFTDRWALVKGMLGPGEMGTRGFADAKGQPGFLPVGPFLVVPDDLERFLAGVTLELWVNGGLRQRSAASEMIWDLPTLVERSFASRDRAYHHAGGTRSILPEPAGIPARALVLSGTPGGVIFQLSSFWRGSLYLQPDDEVVARATSLGALRNRVVQAR